jgi:hypothetical protein
MQGTIPRELEERIIAVAYGDCSIIDRIRIRWLSFRDQRIKNLLKEYRSTAHAVHSIREHELPQRVHSLMERIDLVKNAEKRISFSFFNVHPGYAMMVTVIGILCLALIAYVTLFQEEPSPKYTTAEIDLAQKQVRESLEIVAKVLRKTEIDLDGEILTTKVSVPLNKGLTIVRDYVTGG